MSEPAPRPAEIVRTVRLVRWDRRDLRGGVRGTLLVALPLAIGLATGFPASGALASLGALNLLFVEPPGAGGTRRGVLIASVFINAAAFAGGTLIAIAPGFWEVPFVAVSVFVALSTSWRPGWALSSFSAAVMLVIGTGLPGATLPEAALRGGGILLGGAWACAFVLLDRWMVVPATESRPSAPPPVSPLDARTSRSHAEVVAAAVALGLALGVDLHFARDFWIMLTVLVSLRLDLASTTAFASMRTIGTVGGAAAAFAVTSTVNDPYLQFAILVAAATLLFATRDVNYVVYAFGVTLFVILLLNLAYAGGPGLALTRVLDTAIGGAIAFVTGLLLWVTVHRRGTRSASAG